MIGGRRFLAVLFVLCLNTGVTDSRTVVLGATIRYFQLLQRRDAIEQTQMLLVGTSP